MTYEIYLRPGIISLFGFYGKFHCLTVYDVESIDNKNK